MLNGLSRVGRRYRKLPPHHNFKELADNIEQLSNYFLDRSLGSFAAEGYSKAPTRWEWQLGTDLKMLLSYARDFVPDDSDGTHYHSRRNQK